MNEINEKKGKRKVSSFFISILFSLVATLITYITLNVI